MEVTYDIDLKIATGKSRWETQWKNKVVKWSKIVERVSNVFRTHELYNDYLKMNKDDQANIKDVGGFVGGHLKDGKRSNGYVLSRQLITLDIDYGSKDTWKNLISVLPNTAIAMYSTHKHSPTTPRYRVLIPLKEPVGPEEYEAIARKVAEKINIEIFDDTTYQPTRLMFWQSTAKDGEYVFEFQNGEAIDGAKILAEYDNWSDVSFWPTSSREANITKKLLKKQQDPLEKEGIIGAFCRAYTIQEAMNEFLSDVYEEASDSRYTFKGGSTYAGVVIYDDKFAYSNHSTDPISKQLVNAFDLVRINLFGELDETAKKDTPVNKLPSWKAMVDMCRQDTRTKEKLAEERFEDALKEFDDVVIDDVDTEDLKDKLAFIKELEREESGAKTGEIKPTIDNFVRIIENDPNLNGLGGLNLFNGKYEVTKKLPWLRFKSSWVDDDSAALRHYIETHYKVVHRSNLEDAIAIVFNHHQFHPVKDYLDPLRWDGVERCETLLIDYLGCEDTKYIREISKKVLAAAVARIYNPGVKFDQILTLVGPQGLGKSTLFNYLAGEWFSDTLPDVKGKEAYEALDGVWIMEIPELGAFKKADREQIKSFISKRKDTYRKAFNRYTSDNPRQCIFIGTTNDVDFLDDATGGRRFWIADCTENASKSMWDDLTKNEIDQIWAEAKLIYESGEKIAILSQDVQLMAVQAQENHSQAASMIGLIEKYLEMEIPFNWYDKTIEEQRRWVNATDDFKDEVSKDSNETLHRRNKICSLEIWCVMMEKSKADLTKAMSKYIGECICKIPGWQRSDKLNRYGKYGTQRVYVNDDLL